MIYVENPRKWEERSVKYIFKRRKETNKSDDPEVLALSREAVKVRDISSNQGQLAESYADYHVVKKLDLLLNPMDLISGANCSVSHVEGVISPAYINLYSDIADTTYYDYYFKHQYWSYIMFAYGKGVSFINRWTINNETIMNFKVLYPQKDVQKKIARHLDNKMAIIDSEIEKNNKSIELMEEYRKSIINSAVTPKDNWREEKLKYHFSFRKGLSITKEDLVENGIPVINYGQIHSKQNSGVTLRNELLRYVPEHYLGTYDKCLVKINDFIFADTSEDLEGTGNNIYIDYNKKLFAGYHTIIISPKEEENTKFFAYLFKSEIWRSQLRKRVFGIKLFSITQKILKECTISIPPTNDQKEIVNYLDNKCELIDKIINYRKEIIEKLEEYKRSLIYEVVTGKVEL